MNTHEFDSGKFILKIDGQLQCSCVITSDGIGTHRIVLEIPGRESIQSNFIPLSARWSSTGFLAGVLIIFNIAMFSPPTCLFVPLQGGSSGEQSKRYVKRILPTCAGV